MSKIVTHEEIHNRCLKKGFKLLEQYKRSRDLHKFLCKKHNLYNRKNNTKQQFEEFEKNYAKK